MSRLCQQVLVLAAVSLVGCQVRTRATGIGFGDLDPSDPNVQYFEPGETDLRRDKDTKGVENASMPEFTNQQRR